MTAVTKKNAKESHSQAAIRQALSICQRHHHPVTMLGLEVAHQESLRADIGQARLDTLLSLIHDYLRKKTRCEDIIVNRASNAPLLLVLPATDIDGGHHLAKRVLSRFNKKIFQLDVFQVELSVKIALHSCDVTDQTDSVRLADTTLKLLREKTGTQGLLMSESAQARLSKVNHREEGQLANTLANQTRKASSRRELLSSLKPALSLLPEKERLQLVDHLLDVSTQLDSVSARN